LLLTVTRAHPNKRLDIVLRAFRSIRQSGANASLLIVGPFDNEYGAEVKALAEKLDVSGSVVWAGYLTGETLEACYLAGDLFVLPSAHENFCMAAAEAMAHGLPVVLSKDVGIADVVKHHAAGMVTDVDTEQVTNAIRHLMANPNRRKEMADNAAIVAARMYSGEQVAGLMLRAFTDILSSSRSAECAWS
jgi:glycosyltransferase involved in cell wall biosynthesis